MSDSAELFKPLLRGHFHQAACFVAVGASAMLLALARDGRSAGLAAIYAFSLVGMFAISALYHRPQWSPHRRLWMKRLDHSAIFLLISGTAVPVCLLGMAEEAGHRLLLTIAVMAGLGILRVMFWIRAPKWLQVGLYGVCGGFAVFYFNDLWQGLGTRNLQWLVAGGVVYAIGALVYGFRRPNPFPTTFGFHEVFHVLVILGAAFHFVVVARLVM